MRKWIIIVLIVALVLGVIFYLLTTTLLKKQAPKEGPLTLTVWGLWEPDDFIKGAIDDYQAKNPNITIKYEFQNSLNYRSRLQTQLPEGQGPDVFMIHNTWLPMFLKNGNLASLPSTIMTDADYSKTFYPIAKQSFGQDNKIYALPMEVDGLAMFYNEDILKAAGIEVPQTWVDFAQDAVKLTVIDPTDHQIKTAGAALGTTNNVDHWSDILGLLFLQQMIQYPNENIAHPNTKKGAEVLRFFTQFANSPTTKTWDQNMEPSTQAFYEGKLAFYFGPSWRALDIRTANPQLKFKVAPMPQLSNKIVNWGTFWGFGVSSYTSHQTAAWQFLQYLTSAETEKMLYRQAADARLFGQPYSRVDLQTELVNDPIVGAFVIQAPTYQSWYLTSSTKDQGLDDEMIKYFEDAVNATNQGNDPQGTLDTTAKGVTQTLDKYGAK